MRQRFMFFTLCCLATNPTGSSAHDRHGVAEEITRIGDVIPDAELTDRSGRPIQAATALRDSARTIVVTFTYTRCKTLCPVVVPMAIDLVRKLERDGVPARLIVFTVDPVNDHPAEMAAHAADLAASDDDLFVTGDVTDIRRMLRFFGLTSNDPERHPPLILARRPEAGGFMRMVVGNRTTTERLVAAIRSTGK